jgi:Spy/CpxP family protein refolding chaperone
MKLTKCLSIVAAGALAASGLMVLKTQAAEANAPHAFQGGGRFLERVKEKLGLTDEQVSEIKTQLAAEKDTLNSLITRWHDARVALREAIQAPDATEASVRVAASKVAAVESDLAVERMKLFSKINPILTAEQRDKVKEFQSRIDDFLDNAVNRLGDWLSAHNPQ